MSALQVTWFILIGVLLTGYAVLDGYDLGLGFWHLVTKKESVRRSILRAIGPVWDGNEVWLLTGGGAIFAAFPPVYATVFSGLYLALMLVLLGLIMRGVSIEFRNQIADPKWQRAWDVAFGIGSCIPGLLLGVALGNILRGMSLDDKTNYTGGFFALLNPYALLVGLLGFSMFAVHGALFLATKTDEPVASEARSMAQKAWGVFLALFILVTGVSISTQPQLLTNFRAMPILWALPAVALAAIMAVGHFNKRAQSRSAILASTLSIAALMAIAGASLFPNLVPALGQPELSLTAANASSSELTLKAILILALIGMPIVIAYTWWVHRLFGGKVAAGEEC